MKKYKTKRELCDEDRDNQTANGYENIPAGAIVDLDYFTQNHQTRYANVIYNGTSYFVKPEDIEPIPDANTNG